MTVSTTTNRESFNGNGVTVAFPYTFKAFEDTDIKVIVRSAAGVETTLVLDTHFTATVLATAGGVVTLIGVYAATPPATGETVVVYRDLPYTQEIDHTENDPQRADVAEEGLDRAVILAQQLKDLISRSLLLPVSASPSGLTLPEPDATKYLRWNAAGTALENIALTTTALVVSAFIETLLDDADASAALTTLGVSAFIKTLLDDADAAAAQATLGVPWKQTVGTFTAAPASTSTLTMTADLTASVTVGTPLRYVIGGTTYYGVVSAITSNLLTVAGAPLSGSLTALYFGDPARAIQINLIIPGLYEDATNTDLITSDMAVPFIWDKGESYLVRYKIYSRIHDSHATHGKATIQINNTEVNTSAGGLAVAADATWYSTVVDIAVAAYDINPGEELEIAVTAGGTGDAQDLGVQLTFVIP